MAIYEFHNEKERRWEVVKTFAGDHLEGGYREQMLLNAGIKCAPRLFNSEEDSGKLTLFVELIDGDRLDELDCSTLGVEQKLLLARALAHGVSEFHTKGHWIGDISEDNIIISGRTAYFVDLSTSVHKELGPETKSRFVTPEMDPCHPAPSVGYHVDVHNLGTILGGIDPVLFQEVVAVAHQKYEIRPSSGVILGMIKDLLKDYRLEPERKRVRRTIFILKWAVALVAGVAFLSFSGVISIGAQKSPLPLIETEQDAWELRRGWAEKSPQDRLDLATHISVSENSVALLTKERLDAVFATEIPFAIVAGEPLGPGDFVELGDGETGYIINIRLSKIEIQRADGVEVFETRALTERIGFCFPGSSYYPLPERKIAIWARGKNAERVIEVVQKVIGVEASPPTGYLVGVFTHSTAEGWLESVVNTGSHFNQGSEADLLVFPFRNLNLPSGKWNLEEFFNLPVMGEITLEKEIHLASGEVLEVLEYLNLSMEISEGVVKLNAKER